MRLYETWYCKRKKSNCPSCSGKPAHTGMNDLPPFRIEQKYHFVQLLKSHKIEIWLLPQLSLNLCGPIDAGIPCEKSN